MKQKLFTLLLAVAASAGTMFAWDYERVQIADLYYNLDASSQTAEVTSQNSSYPYWSTTITTANIPSSVTYNSVPYSVTSIGESAFDGCSGLTSVTISNSVTNIGERAFYYCTGLTSVTIPNSVTSIGNYAFWNVLNIVYNGTATGSPWGAKSMNGYVDGYLVYSDATKTVLLGCSLKAIGEIVIPNSVTSIGNYAFSDCRGLTSVMIPNSVTSIGNNAFMFCTGLTSVTIPNSVTSIGDEAFLCSFLTSVTIPNSVTSIGDAAFDGCPDLTSPVYNAHVFAYMPTSYSGAYTIPDGIESIAGSAFRSCTGLTSVTIPNSVTSIGYRAFYGCTGLPVIDNIRYADTYLVEAVDKTLSTYTIKEGTKWIGTSAFSGCRGLTSVTIPNSVTSIGNYAFSDCRGLTSVTIPNSVTSIGEGAFWGCDGLTSVTIGNSVTSIGSNAFMFCDGLTSVTIPNSVTSIGNSAFEGCSGLTSVTIGNSVTSIGKEAFWGCDGLTSVTIKAMTPPALNQSDYGIFYGVSNCPIYVPCGTLEAYKTAWADYASRIKYGLAIDFITTYAANGYVDISAYDNNTNATICDGELFTLTPIPNNGYHFTQWSDGNTDNPRTIVLTQDTTFTAEFTKNTYTITTESSNSAWGTTAGDTAALYLDEVEISAIPNYGYHFVQWDDNNTLNPRSFTLTQDTTFTATFAKNVYSITKNAEHGIILGNTSAEYLDEVTLTANPDYGYHFTQWSDGNTDNPRTIVLTQDTTFTAEIVIDKTGNCGDDNALTWTYDAETKTLTITGNGTLNSNYYFGIEAPTQMQKLVIGNEVTAIGDSAFYEMSSINHLIIGGSVATIGNYAFAECRNFDDITCYATIVPVINETTFANVGNKQYIYLFVPEARERAYHRDTYWGEFDIQVQQAEETTVTTNDVTVEPQNNAATLTWPTSNNATSYTIQITKDGVLFCTLIFNANGQLIGIAFAPSRDGSYHAPAAIMTANGLQFTVTGLNSNTQYGYSVTAKDSNDQPVATYSGEFTTTGEGTAAGVEEISSSLQGGDRGRLILRDGQIFILRGEKVYTVTGQEVK